MYYYCVPIYLFLSLRTKDLNQETQEKTHQLTKKTYLSSNLCCNMEIQHFLIHVILAKLQIELFILYHYMLHYKF